MTRRSRQMPGRLSPFVLLFLILALLAEPAASQPQIKRGSEMMGGGGAPGQGGSIQIHDTVAQCPIGSPGSGTARLYDGFWLTLPGVNVPVEGSFSAVLSGPTTATLRWTVASLSEIEGFNVYRSTSEDGPFERVNDATIPAIPGPPWEYADDTLWPETTFWYELRAALIDGTEDVVGPALAMVETEGKLVMRLYPASPNPSPGGVSIRLDIPDHVGPVNLLVYNTRGQMVRSIVDGSVERGRHTVRWDGLDQNGERAASGVYLLRLEVDGRGESGKILLLR